MPERHSFVLEVDGGPDLHGIVDLPAEPGARPTVVDCHGFKGFMEWGFHPYLADLLAERGFTVIRFNVTSSGMRPGDDRVTDEEAFAHATVGDDVREIGEILQAAIDGRVAAGRVDADRIGLFGHSRGGGTSILTAGSDRWRERLRALVTWASVSTFDRVDAEATDEWRRSGSLPIVNARTGQQLRLDVSVLEDAEANHDAYDVGAAAARIEAPWLLLHGDRDETVPVAEAAVLAEAAGGTFERHIVEGGDHTFGAAHPFAGPNPKLIEALNATQIWFRRHLCAD